MDANVKNYFSELSFRFDIIRKHTYETDMFLSSRFSVFDYIEVDENRLSDLIADLLNPYGKHGQRDLFLNEFLKIISRSELISNHLPKVYREVSTSHILRTQRRMDILIDWNNDFAIVIENKPWALDQENQIIDYKIHLEEKYRNQFLIVYLSKSNQAPDNNSISKDELEILISNNQFVKISFEYELIIWINKCLQKCQSEKIRWYLKDLQNFLEKNFKI